jgi:DNA-binding NarL/FixJ family response regulator
VTARQFDAKLLGSVQAEPRAPLLVVEDEPAIARTISRIVRRELPIRVAPTIAAARDLACGDERLAAAVLDIGLPDGSGLDFLAELRQVRPTLRVLVLTVHHEPETVNRAQLLGAEYAVKPHFTEGLKAFVARVADPTPAFEARTLRAIGEYAARYALSPRERDLLILAVAERSREEIAADLGISVNTVKIHTRLLLVKCGEETLADLARKIRAELRSVDR